jgi:hypothetical protein
MLGTVFAKTANFCMFRFVGLLTRIWDFITHVVHWLLGHPHHAD